MDQIQQSFSVQFSYPVIFTEHLFDRGNPVLRQFLQSAPSGSLRKIFFVVDDGVLKAHAYLEKDIRAYFGEDTPGFSLQDLMIVPGGERAKNDEKLFYRIVDGVDKYGIDRHSYIAAVGGGSVLDLAGYAAAVSHRGIRHIRIPTTVLSQNDSGVGVKNGINYGGKKNFLGSFAPPAAVFNDYYFLTSLSPEEWRSGMSEAVKVSLIRDRVFFRWLEEHADALAARDMESMKYLIRRCAALHLEHIAGGDPFEMGSSRPLDFGHWSAHKLEQLSDFTVRHGEAVAMGIALDTAYSFVSGRLPEEDARRILRLIRNLGFPLTHPLLEIRSGEAPILKGLEEFREHLGGELTIMLLKGIGTGEEVHALDPGLLQQAGDWVRDFS